LPKNYRFVMKSQPRSRHPARVPTRPRPPSATGHEPKRTRAEFTGEEKNAAIDGEPRRTRRAYATQADGLARTSRSRRNGSRRLLERRRSLDGQGAARGDRPDGHRVDALEPYRDH